MEENQIKGCYLTERVFKTPEKEQINKRPFVASFPESLGSKLSDLLYLRI